MSSLANPNWLAVGAAFFSMCGAGLLTRALLKGTTSSLDAEARRRADAVRKVAVAAGAPLLAIGLFLQAVSQFATAALTPQMTFVMLVLAFIMLLYGCLEQTFVDTLLTETEKDREEATRKGPRLALLPTTAAPEPIEVAAEPRVAEAAG